MTAVTVLGVGAMGATIAKLFAAKGREVTAWNRTREKAESLELTGVSIAPTADAVRGRTLVQLTTGSPADAREMAAWASSHGAAYLDGAIQAAPSQMGRADTPILISGDQSALERWKPVLEDLAGNYVNLGGSIEAAETMDLATLSYVYGAFVGFVHGALIAETEQLDVGRFGQLVADISPSLGAFFAHEGRVIQSGDFRITESPLRISVEATQRIHAFSEDRGLNSEFPGAGEPAAPASARQWAGRRGARRDDQGAAHVVAQGAATRRSLRPAPLAARSAGRVRTASGERGMRGSVRMTSRRRERGLPGSHRTGAPGTGRGAEPAHTRDGTAAGDVLAGELLAAVRTLERGLRPQARQPAQSRTSQPVTTAELTVLRCLVETSGLQSLTAVAECIHRDASSVSVIVQHLHERRLVQKRPDPVDRRRVLLAASPRGRRVVQVRPDEVRTALARAVAEWPADRVRGATELLVQLAVAVRNGR